jgi:hypothetical protein
MTSVVVYIINGNLNYYRMALNSIKMLRKYNKSIRILCFCTHNETIFPEEFMVETRYVKNIDPEYFPANKQHLSDLEFDNIFYLDSDTFIFDDIDKIINKYPEDIVGCENRWSYSAEFKLFRPINSGVLLFRNGSNKKIYKDFNKKLENIEEVYPALWRWLDKYNMWVREEFLMSQIAIDNKEISKNYFKREHVKIPEIANDFEYIDPIIFHTYTHNWEKLLKFKNVKRKVLRPKLKSGGFQH